MNIEQQYNATMVEASREYRKATAKVFETYVKSCELAWAKYKFAPGDVLIAQGVCRGEIETAGHVYDNKVAGALEIYEAVRDKALQNYWNIKI